MGCFFKTATRHIHSNNKHSKHNKSNETNDSNTNNQNLTPSATRAKDYDNRITFENKDIHKDFNQQISSKTCHSEGGEELCEEPEERERKKQSREAVTLRVKKKLKERVKHRQQKQTLEEVTTTTTTISAEPENEGEEDSINDTEYFHRTSLSDCSFPRVERQTSSTLKHTYNNRNINKYFHSNGSCWGQTLFPQQQRKPNNATTTCTQTTTRTRRNMAAAVASVGTSSQTVSQLLLLARDHLAACLGNVSTCVMEKWAGCAATASRTRVSKRKMKTQQQQRHQQTRKLPREQQRRANYLPCQEQTADAETTHCIPESNEHCDQSCNTDRHNRSQCNNRFNTLRSSVNFYAASSVILVFCCLTSTVAATSSINSASIDKHPIHGIDWSKFDESSSDKEILDLLLEKKRYDKRLLPPVNDEDFCCGLSSPDMAKDKSSTRSHNRGTLTVNVNVLLLSLASPDESSLKYEVEFLLNQQWNDPRLQYGNKSEYEYLNALHHHDNIWTPDTYFIMHGDFKDPIIPMHFALRIYRNGTITYAMRRHLILSCQGSLHIFPFDDPKCSFSMESISYEEPQIKYVWKNDEDTLRKSPSLTTLNAYLIKNQTTPCDQNSWRGNYSCLRVDLIFTRDRAFYFTTVFIPGIILVTSSFITFWLEWNAVPARSMIGNYSCLQVEMTFTRDRAYYFTTVFIPGIILVTSSFITFWLEWNAVPARVMIGVTTMLNFFTTSNGFRSTLPVVSNLTAMNVWDGVCMCFIYASLLEFVCVNYVGRKRPLHNVVYRPGENPVTQRLPAVLSRIGVILASPLEIIEREFHAALSSEKAAAGTSTTGGSMPTTTTASPLVTPTATTGAQHHGSIIGAAVHHLRARSVKNRSQCRDIHEPQCMEPVYVAPTSIAATAVALRADEMHNDWPSGPHMRHSRSMSTNTPPLILRDARINALHQKGAMSMATATPKMADIDYAERQMPIKPPRKKTSRSTSPAVVFYEETPANRGKIEGVAGGAGRTAGGESTGEKRREASAPNEIVACTSCGGGNSPCTHSANNGCATETCFVQVRKKEPPHPIRVAKTIDVIARITFPTAYSIFLIFFFVHYKGFS